MKSLWNSFKAAFAMFSKIPMPMVDWKKENIKYMMCFFPFVGTCHRHPDLACRRGPRVHVALEPFFLCCDPYCDPGTLFTGGIHVDGRSGHVRCIKLLAGTHKEAGDPEGFPCRCICHYHSLCIFYPLAGSLGSAPWNYNGICIMSLGFMMSRCLSGIGVITFPKARTDGTVAEFSRNASEIAVRNVLITMFVILAALMIWVDPVLGVLAAVSALLVFWWYHHMALKYFGGTTGDLSGFFLCICEVVMALVLAFGGAFNL